MTKITAEHLARSAYVYIRQSTACCTITRADVDNMLSPSVRVISAGSPSRSSTMILAAPVAESPDPGSIV